MTRLLIATSPRSTWITAVDAETARRVRGLLGDSAREASRWGEEGPLTVDVGNGVEAMEAGSVLIGAGYSFAWHPDQDPRNRQATAWGIPVENS